MFYKSTPSGKVPFTQAEMQEWEEMEAEYAANADNRKAEEVRARRNTLLAKTDFYALSDVTMPEEMAAYRQALRDITAHAEFPNLVDDDWPTEEPVVEEPATP